MEGFVTTGLSRYSSAVSRTFFKIFGSSPEKGAETPIYLASSPNVEGISGECFEKKRIAKTSRNSNDPVLASKLWDLSVKYTERWI